MIIIASVISHSIELCRMFVQKPDFLVDELRIDLDCTAANTWCELDAIELVGSKFNFGMYIVVLMCGYAPFSSYYN